MNGSVDVAGLMEPYANYLRTQGGYRVLFDANDIFGTKQFTLHFVNSIWARENPKAATAFVSGIVESINWIEANQDEAKKIISKYTGVDEKYVPVYHFQKNGVVIMDDVSFWMDFMKSIGDLNADWLKPEDIATNVYNNKAQ
jgi:ABC-type nitrate/sulfonate/bicarbonate transport system substrate-binding protein